MPPQGPGASRSSHGYICVDETCEQLKPQYVGRLIWDFGDEKENVIHVF